MRRRQLTVNQGYSQQGQGQGPRPSALVLPGLREAVPGREWLQVPRPIRGPLARHARRRRARRPPRVQLLVRVRGQLHPDPQPSLWHQAGQSALASTWIDGADGPLAQANNVYQELISNKTHTHMNATRWVTLTEFCKYLGRSGKAHVEDTEKGIFISCVLCCDSCDFVCQGVRPARRSHDNEPDADLVPAGSTTRLRRSPSRPPTRPASGWTSTTSNASAA